MRVAKAQCKQANTPRGDESEDKSDNDDDEDEETSLKVQSYYKQIKGIKYNRELLEMADKLTKGRGDGRISKADAGKLCEAARDGPGITDCERLTLKYVYDNFKCTEAAQKVLDTELPSETNKEESDEEEDAEEEEEDAEEQEDKEGKVVSQCVHAFLYSTMTVFDPHSAPLHSEPGTRY